jgi:hypothetical protein
MVITYANIFHSKALQIFPKLGFFWFEIKPSGNPDPQGYVQKLFATSIDRRREKKSGQAYLRNFKLFEPSGTNPRSWVRRSFDYFRLLSARRLNQLGDFAPFEDRNGFTVGQQESVSGDELVLGSGTLLGTQWMLTL